ncbi:MAG: NAD-dependent epimerase/dehydratase family protein [Alphaproteobacteria bacterium]|jgi:UDP-glucuronate 4-epimerase|nr:NAD-dependent epimerase/dehydratase family protein [Alphaproteobacteria bacterium]
MADTILLTGAAGFIGFACAQRLLAEGWRVVGVDNLNDYYTPALKQARLAELAKHPQAANFAFHRLDLADLAELTALALATKPSMILHLAAQAGVRYGLQAQQPYLHSNLIGHFNVLQASKSLAEAGAPVQHLLYASSSSVYGNREDDAAGFRETDNVSTPASLYAATKVADEAISHAWAAQFGTPLTGMRFFTVYGPWGRPDMSPLLFLQALHQGQEIQLFNHGDLWRDFTYIDDIVEAIVRLIPAAPTTKVPHEVYNLGNQQPTRLDAYIATLEEVTGRTAKLNKVPRPATEVYRTAANTEKLQAAVGWAPSTPLATGLAKLNDWYLAHRELLG